MPFKFGPTVFPSPLKIWQVAQFFVKTALPISESPVLSVRGIFAATSLLRSLLMVTPLDRITSRMPWRTSADGYLERMPTCCVERSEMCSSPALIKDRSCVVSSGRDTMTRRTSARSAGVAVLLMRANRSASPCAFDRLIVWIRPTDRLMGECGPIKPSIASAESTRPESSCISSLAALIRSLMAKLPSSIRRMNPATMGAISFCSAWFDHDAANRANDAFTETDADTKTD